MRRMVSSGSEETSLRVNAGSGQEMLAAEMVCNGQIRLYLKDFKDRVPGVCQGPII